MENKTMIICGFPGIGKTNAAMIFNGVIDCECTPYHDHFGDKWVDAYVDRIEMLANDGHYNFVLTSTHQVVRDEMDRRGIDYIIVVPKMFDCLDEYLARYLCRRDDYDFLKNIQDNWFSWISDIMEYRTRGVVIELEKGQYLGDILKGYCWENNGRGGKK